MSEKTPSIIGGTVNEIIGKVKETTGKVFKNKSMETKGHMQREMGSAEVEAAKRRKAEKKAQKHRAKDSKVHQPREAQVGGEDVVIGNQKTYIPPAPPDANSTY